MNLLLLLSALLSALTGVQAGARTQQAATAVMQATPATSKAQAVRATVAGRPVASLPALPASARLVTSPAWRLPAMAPLFLSRRRE